MKVKYVGFGGTVFDYPCYEDEKGKLYFDENNGKGELLLYTGAYRHPEDNDICGEPYALVEETVECDEPFKRSPREHDYRMLSRLKMDCEYYLGCGNRYEGDLYYKDVYKHIKEMKNIYNSFLDNEKPEWLTMEQIEKYEKEMIIC